MGCLLLASVMDRDLLVHHERDTLPAAVRSRALADLAVTSSAIDRSIFLLGFHVGAGGRHSRFRAALRSGDAALESVAQPASYREDLACCSGFHAYRGAAVDPRTSYAARLEPVWVSYNEPDLHGIGQGNPAIQYLARSSRHGMDIRVRLSVPLSGAARTALALDVFPEWNYRLFHRRGPRHGRLGRRAQ